MSGRPSVAKRYHNNTKYTEEKLNSDPHEIDWNSQPEPFKEYASSTRISLGQYLPIQPNIFMEDDDSKISESVPGYDWNSTLGRVSRVLYMANGITAFVQTAGGKHALRAAPSAGALYPTEIYVAVRNTPTIPDGLYNYQVLTHSLISHWEGDFWRDLGRASYEHDAIAQSDIVFIVSGVWFRSFWRYADRGYRRALLDTGHVLGNMISYAQVEGYHPYVIAGFYDDIVSSLMMFDEEKEATLALVAFPEEDKVESIKSHPSAIYATVIQSSVEGSRAVDLHKNSRLAGNLTAADAKVLNFENLAGKFSDKKEIELSSGLLPLKSTVQEMILKRRSARGFSETSMTSEQLGSVLSFAYQPLLDMAGGNSSPEDSALMDPSILESYIISLGVDDIPDGVYYYSPIGNKLRLLREGDFREKCWHSCLGQDLGRDASAILIHTVDLDQALDSHGERVYRTVHMDAGQIGERVNLSSVALELGSSGLGGFFDDEINGILGLSLNTIIVYVTAIGVPS